MTPITARPPAGDRATRPTDGGRVLDSTARGRAQDGFRSSARSTTRCRFEPTTALVGVATQGGRFPPAGASCSRRRSRAGLDVESGLHEFISEDAELAELAARHGVELRDLRKPPAELNVPDRREPRHPGADRAHRRLRLRDREDDRRARARPRGPAPRSRLRVRPDRPDGDRDRRLGDRRRRGRRRLPRRRGRAARRRGPSPRRRAPLRRGPGLALASRLLGGHPRPDARLRAARLRALPQGRPDEIEGYPGFPLPRLPELVELHERIALPLRPAARRLSGAEHAGSTTTPARAAIAAADEETGLPADDPVRFGAGPTLDAVLTAFEAQASTVPADH